MSKREHNLYLNDIRNCTQKVMDYTHDQTFQEFIADGMRVDAVVRNLEIIGEAVKNLPEDFKTRHPEIEWKKIAGFRDVVVHMYFKIDFEILWDIVKKRVPELHARIVKVISLEIGPTGNDGRN
jgi:uncharacterized protein with HEPN domain